MSRAELLLRPVVEREPLQPKFGLALQDALHSLGFYYRGTDKSEDAIRVHAEALTIAERLVQSYPDEPIHHQRLARAQTVMGWTLDSAPGKREAARKMFGQGFDTAKAFAKQHPDSPLAQGELGLSSHVLGSQMIADRRYQEAESYLIDATRLLEKVAYKTPHEYGYRDMLAAATTELGDLMRLTGRPEEAKEWERSGRWSISQGSRFFRPYRDFVLASFVLTHR